MPVKFSHTGLAIAPDTPIRGLPEFCDAILRGIGQVMLQNNSYAGLLFLVGIFYNSWLFGVGVLVGTTTATLTAALMRADRKLVRDGLFGFNGALVAIALLYFLQPTPLAWACVVFAAICSSIVMAGLMAALEVWHLPVLTAPFVITTLCFFLTIARFGRLQSTGLLPTAGLPSAVMVEGTVTATTLVQGLFNGIAQVFFQGNLVTGIIFAAGLLVSSRRGCVAALLGSFTGVLVAWGMGAAEPAIRDGAFGFNSVLTAIAVGSLFFKLTPTSLAYTAVAAIATVFVYAALSAALQPVGMPAMTLPFVMVVWVCVLAGSKFARLQSE